MFFRSQGGKPVACLCLNSDVNDVERAKEVLHEIVTALKGALV